MHANNNYCEISWPLHTNSLLQKYFKYINCSLDKNKIMMRENLKTTSDKG